MNSFYLSPPPKGQKADDLYIHQQLAIDAIKNYLEYIGIKFLGINRIEHGQSPNFYISSPSTSFVWSKVRGSCSLEDYKYFRDYSICMQTIRHPKINNDILYGSANFGGLSATMFHYDEYVEFEFNVNLSSIDDIDKSLIKLKENTEELRFKKFSAQFDKQVEDELDAK